jgi:hypothetical protein
VKHATPSTSAQDAGFFVADVYVVDTRDRR